MSVPPALPAALRQWLAKEGIDCEAYAAALSSLSSRRFLRLRAFAAEAYERDNCATAQTIAEERGKARAEEEEEEEVGAAVAREQSAVDTDASSTSGRDEGRSASRAKGETAEEARGEGQEERKGEKEGREQRVEVCFNTHGHTHTHISSTHAHTHMEERRRQREKEGTQED